MYNVIMLSKGAEIFLCIMVFILVCAFVGFIISVIHAIEHDIEVDNIFLHKKK